MASLIDVTIVALASGTVSTAAADDDDGDGDKQTWIIEFIFGLVRDETNEM